VSTIVTLRGITKSYRRGDSDMVVLDDLHASIGSGEVVIIRGRSGSGKTTLLNILSGWQSPDSGSVDWGMDQPHSWDRVAVVPQSLGLLPELTLGENIGLPGRLAAGVQAGSGQLELHRALAHSECGIRPRVPWRSRSRISAGSSLCASAMDSSSSE